MITVKKYKITKRDFLIIILFFYCRCNLIYSIVQNCSEHFTGQNCDLKCDLTKCEDPDCTAGKINFVLHIGIYLSYIFCYYIYNKLYICTNTIPIVSISCKLCLFLQWKNVTRKCRQDFLYHPKQQGQFPVHLQPHLYRKAPGKPCLLLLVYTLNQHQLITIANQWRWDMKQQYFQVHFPKPHPVLQHFYLQTHPLSRTGARLDLSWRLKHILHRTIQHMFSTEKTRAAKWILQPDIWQ